MMEPFGKMNSSGWSGQSVVDRVKVNCAHQPLKRTEHPT